MRRLTGCGKGATDKMISMIATTILMAIIVVVSRSIGASDETTLLYCVILLSGGLAGIKK